MRLRHFFIPHTETHKRAHLLSWKAIAVYCLLFLVLQLGFTAVNKIQPGVLGIESNVDQKELINLTNQQRVKKGVNPVVENEKLNQAAYQKALNMFEEDYWAHYSPTGKDPWGFINNAGYKFSYAGENLARNFYTSNEVVDAWMNSPSHRDNLLNDKYTEIGIAVVQGTLKGQQTTLVVQEFGRPFDAVAYVPKEAGQSGVREKVTQVPVENINIDNRTLPVNASNIMGNTNLLIDPYQLTKNLGLGLVIVLIGLLMLDWLILKHRGVMVISSRHLPHMALLGMAGSMFIGGSPGSIL